MAVGKQRSWWSVVGVFVCVNGTAIACVTSGWVIFTHVGNCYAARLSTWNRWFFEQTATLWWVIITQVVLGWFAKRLESLGLTNWHVRCNNNDKRTKRTTNKSNEVKL